MSDIMEFVKKIAAINDAELAAWRSRYPREAAAVHEEAKAKVEGRARTPKVSGSSQP